MFTKFWNPGIFPGSEVRVSLKITRSNTKDCLLSQPQRRPEKWTRRKSKNRKLLKYWKRKEVSEARAISRVWFPLLLWKFVCQKSFDSVLRISSPKIESETSSKIDSETRPPEEEAWSALFERGRRVSSSGRFQSFQQVLNSLSVL